MIDGSGSAASSVSGLCAGGGATWTSLSGGNSSISEKLTPFEPAPVFSAIMGSTAIFGFSVVGSSTTADDILALLFVMASNDALTAEVTNCALGSSVGAFAAAEFPAEFQPAA